MSKTNVKHVLGGVTKKKTCFRRLWYIGSFGKNDIWLYSKERCTQSFGTGDYALSLLGNKGLRQWESYINLELGSLYINTEDAMNLSWERTWFSECQEFLRQLSLGAELFHEFSREFYRCIVPSVLIDATHKIYSLADVIKQDDDIIQEFYYLSLLIIITCKIKTYVINFN